MQHKQKHLDAGHLTPADTQPLLCYNMFPTMYSSLDEMTESLPEVRKMGFNTVWINPIQKTGKTHAERRSKNYLDNDIQDDKLLVRNSLYAMADNTYIDKRFSSIRRENDIPVIALETIKKHAANLPLNIPGETKKKYTKVELTSYLSNPKSANPDVKKSERHILEEVCYLEDRAAVRRFTEAAKQNGLNPMFDLVLHHLAKDNPLITANPAAKSLVKSDTSRFDDVVDLNYDAHEDTLVEQVWEPFIKKYIVEFGFRSVRIDAARFMESTLKNKIYKFIRDTLQKEDPEFCKRRGVVILEEVLYSKEHPATYADKQRDVKHKASHNTSSAFYASKMDLPPWIAEESHYKSSCVGHGSINFTSSHDEYPAVVATIKNRIKGGMNEPIDWNWLDQEVGATLRTLEVQGSLDAETLKACKRHFLVTMLVGRNGYCMLSKDQHANIMAPSVFIEGRNAPQEPFKENPSYFCLQMEVFSPLIKNINGIYKNLMLPRSENEFDVTIINDHTKDNVLIIRRIITTHISKSERVSHTDVILCDIGSEIRTPADLAAICQGEYKEQKDITLHYCLTALPEKTHDPFFESTIPKLNTGYTNPYSPLNSPSSALPPPITFVAHSPDHASNLSALSREAQLPLTKKVGDPPSVLDSASLNKEVPKKEATQKKFG